MRRQMTYSELRELQMDFNTQAMKSPAFRFLYADKIGRFYKMNSMRLKLMEEKMDGFIKKYVKHDGEDKPVTKDADGRKVYDFETPENEAAYKEEAEKFLSITFDVNL